MRERIARYFIARFERRYQYDASYLRDLLRMSPAAFFQFLPMQKLSRHHETAPAEALYAAKIAGALHEDCGPCVQINVDMAREAGVDDAVIAAILANDEPAMGEAASCALRFARAILRRETAEAERDVVRAAWGDRGVVDLVIAVQIARLPPMLKAGLGHARACARITIGDLVVASHQ